MILVIPFAGVLKDVPLATLAAILIFIALRLFHVRDLLAIARFNRFEFALAAVTLAHRGAHRGGTGHRGRRRPRHPRPHPPQRPPPAARARAYPGHHQLAAPMSSIRARSWCPASLAAALRDADLVRQRHAFPRGGAPSCGDPAQPVRVFVLDTIGMSDIDFTGTRALGHVLDLCEREHIAFGIARAGVHLHESLRRSGLAARIGADHFYSTVDAAVTALAEPPPPA